MLERTVFEGGLLTRADSLEELAEKLGINAAGLVHTVAQFNEHARRGEDPLFGRGQSEHDKYYADRKNLPNPSLGPLTRAPFYALRCEAGDLDTKGGLKCDQFARVLNADNQVIRGLYAAG